LWRPFPEFDGGRFWWGKGGAEAFKKLWILMYDRYTNTYKLNNLIWVLGYSSEVKAGWYPGDAYVDIAGADAYTAGTQSSLFNKVKNIVGGDIPICYHECGPIPNPDEMFADGTNWVWFLTWHTTYLKDQNTVAALRKIYTHVHVYTLGELPNLKSGTYPTPTHIPPYPIATGSLTPTPSPTAGCSVNYFIQTDWGGGATVNLTVKNNSPETVKGWTLVWTSPDNQIITNLWNATFTQSATTVTVKNAAFNETIAAGGGTVNFGFGLSYSGSNPKPAGFTLNGSACKVE
jgi:hypothetical protein